MWLNVNLRWVTLNLSCYDSTEVVTFFSKCDSSVVVTVSGQGPEEVGDMECVHS